MDHGYSCLYLLEEYFDLPRHYQRIYQSPTNSTARQSDSRTPAFTVSLAGFNREASHKWMTGGGRKEGLGTAPPRPHGRPHASRIRRPRFSVRNIIRSKQAHVTCSVPLPPVPRRHRSRYVARFRRRTSRSYCPSPCSRQPIPIHGC
jgi:hypothetical protein